MHFASTRLIAADIDSLVAFYETLTGLTAEWLAPVFAQFATERGTLAIGSAETVALFREGSAEPAANRSAILEFRVADVDAEHARLAGKVEVVQAPKLMPWGNKAAQYRDPEGTLVSLFTPMSDEARTRASRSVQSSTLSK
ncbi:VOC family protein [Croceibacterium aestuarii]|uniref:VOC family protein n=1 Tax=Croceibacterium aestuarii TaxID=3064139 RepID=UPI00272EB980|nr:VOC family protein [Croceibacterium sp. D39]